ncbi:leucine-rich repeat flightless-interacting protein 1-like isoform X1, partial [Clarias magur]
MSQDLKVSISVVKPLDVAVQVSLADTEEKLYKALEAVAQLEREKASLTFEVKSLQSTMQDMRTLFSETEREYKKEQELEKATHNILQSEYEQMKKTAMQNEELLKLMEKERETHSMLRVRYGQVVETLQQNEKLLEVMEKELVAHSRMNLRYTQLTEMLLRNDKLIEVMDKEREAHSKLRVKYNHMVETLLENGKLLEEGDSECGSTMADDQPGTSSDGNTESCAGGTAGKLGQKVFGDKTVKCCSGSCRPFLSLVQYGALTAASSVFAQFPGRVASFCLHAAFPLRQMYQRCPVRLRAVSSD